jgi:hypothetical protein
VEVEVEEGLLYCKLRGARCRQETEQSRAEQSRAAPKQNRAEHSTEQQRNDPRPKAPSSTKIQSPELALALALALALQGATMHLPMDQGTVSERATTRIMAAAGHGHGNGKGDCDGMMVMV